jgi:hypothetical protein
MSLPEGEISMRTQLRRITLVAVCLVALLAIGSGNAFADNNPLITLDENGHGTLLFPGGSPIPTTGVLAPDPGPGGLASALTYNLLGPPGLVAGDLVLLDAGNTVSDVIRFNPAGSGQNPGYPASVVFYSLLGEGALADTGLPLALYTNVFAAFEVNGGYVYTPNESQPGYVPGFAVTYSLQSDASPVPEPGSLALLGSGFVGLIGTVRRRFKV